MQTANDAYITARVPPGLVDLLRTQAVKNDRSLSAELRRAIAAHVTGEPAFEHRGGGSTAAETAAR